MDWIRVITNLATVVIILSLPILALIWPGYYYNAFSRYQVYTNFNQIQDVDALNSNFSEVMVVTLPFTDSSVMDESFFSREDILHMQDVDRLFDLVWISLVGGVIVLLCVAAVKPDKVKQSLKTIGRSLPKILLALTAATALILVTWEHSFILFHQLLFPWNTYWQLDPSSSNLIKFLPAQIFQELAGIYVIVLGLICCPIWYLSKRTDESKSS